jgi:hypothetical protein
LAADFLTVESKGGDAVIIFIIMTEPGYENFCLGWIQMSCLFMAPPSLAAARGV